MRSNLNLLGLCTLFALGWLACSPASAEVTGQANLISNGSFEQGLKSWQVFNARLDTVSGASHSGGSCCTGWIPDRIGQLSSLRQHLKLEPGAEYRVTFWARSETGTSVGAVWADFATESDNRVLLVAKSIPTSWNSYTTIFRARPADTTLDFHMPQSWVGLGGAANPGRAWIDDIVVQRTTSPVVRDTREWAKIKPDLNETLFDPENGYDIAPVMARDEAGIIYLAWMRNVRGSDRDPAVRSQQVMLRRFDGRNWSGPVVVAGKTGLRVSPSIAAGKSGVWMTWAEEKANGKWRVVAEYRGDRSIQRITVADDDHTNRAPLVCIDANGAPWFAWETGSSGLSDVAVRRYDPVRRRLSPISVASRLTDNGQYPALAADSRGNVWVAWSAFQDTRYQLWVQKMPVDGTPEKPVRISLWNRDNLHPTLACVGNRLWIAWSTSTRENVKGRQYPRYDDDPRWYAYKYEKGIAVACCVDGTRWYVPNSAENQASPGIFFTLPAGAQAGVPHSGPEQPRLVPTTSGAPLLIYRQLDPAARSNGWSTYAASLGADGWKQLNIGAVRQGLSAPASAVVDSQGNVWIAQQEDSRVSGGYFQRFDGDSWISIRKITSIPNDAAWEQCLVENASIAATQPSSSVPSPAPRHSITYGGKTYNLYFGDLHVHTDMSTCAKTVQDFQDDSLKTSHYAGGLDFSMLADHGEHMNQNDWCIEKSVISTNNVPGAFVTFSGEEWSSLIIGHNNIVYKDMGGRRIDPRKQEFFDTRASLKEGQALMIPHHPADSVHTGDWDYHDPRFQKLVEVFQARLSQESPDAPCVIPQDVPGSFVSDGLARGYRMGFIASPDHPGKFGTAAVYATDLSRDAIFDALLNKRCYASVEPTAFLDFRVDDHLMGETIPAEPRKTPHTINITAETSAPIESIVLIRNGKQLHEFSEAVGKKTVRLSYVDQHPDEAPAIGRPGEQTVYYYVRVVEQGERKTNIGQAYKHMSWSSPVWITLDPEPSGLSSFKVLEPPGKQGN